MRQYINDPYGVNLGMITTDECGNKTVFNMAGQVLGYYNASSGLTTDCRGRVLYQGDMASALLIIFR